MEIFKVAEYELEPGQHVLEASAGTGKTFSLEWLYLRMIIEKAYTVEEILVVTFTEAATQELRDRIRKRIAKAARHVSRLLRGEDAATDDNNDARILTALLNGFNEAELLKTSLNLSLALAGFDANRIFTIHGFCQRLLNDNAFDSGHDVGRTLTPDADSLLDEATRNFFRRYLYSHYPFCYVCLRTAGFIEQCKKSLGLYYQLKFPAVLPERSERSLGAMESELKTALAELSKVWSEGAGERIRALFKGFEFLGGKDIYTPVFWAEIDSLFALNGRNGAQAAKRLSMLWQLRPEAIVDAVKKACRDKVDDPFFDECGRLFEMMNGTALAVLRFFLDEAKRQCEEIKLRRKVWTFDDLLLEADAAVGKADGGVQLARDYRAALIDEFQDTDAVQWRIFNSLFGRGDRELFLVGDPKQAIYSFRGADVLAYLAACESARKRSRLGTNWRSEEKLVEAVNALFGLRDDCFLEKGIVFEPAEANPDYDPSRCLRTEAGKDQPMRIRLLPTPESKNCHSKGDCGKYIEPDIVREICRLLEPGTRLGDRPLLPGDIAVLTRAGAEGVEIQQPLRAAGIPSVLKSELSIYRTAEAAEIALVMGAAIQPQDEAALRAALSTPLFGTDGRRIEELFHNEPEWLEVLDRFADYGAKWRRSGFMVMFRSLLEREGSRASVARQIGGERKLANYLHLAELLHQQELSLRVPPESLFQYLLRQREETSSGTDDRELRIESDREAVQILTAHKSKGLEFPVVFCPYLFFGKSSQKSKTFSFHDPVSRERVISLPGDTTIENAAEIAAMEALQDEIRLLYVALTRARNRCYLYVGNTRDYKQSSVFRAFADGAGEGKYEALEDALRELGEKMPEHFHVAEVETDEPVPRYSCGVDEGQALSAAEFKGAIDRSRMIGSFSMLKGGVRPEQPDRDQFAEADAEAGGEEQRRERAEAFTIHTFPKGAKAGLFFHDVLEHLDFADDSEWEKLIESKLRVHGFSVDAWKGVVEGNLRKLVDIPLPGAAGFSLSQLGNDAKLVETEFHFPIKRLTPERLARLAGQLPPGEGAFPAAFPAQLERLTFDTVDGYLYGIIDMVFEHEGRYFLLDWKSNWLGPTAASYTPAKLEGEMTSAYYHLQSYLYTVALHLFLAERVPHYDYERCFGGAYYVFLRGLDGECGGIHHAKIAEASLAALSE